MTIDQLPAAWPIGEPYRLRPTTSGISRGSQFLDAPSGSYVLSISPDRIDAPRVRYEHALLGALAAGDLPFAVPAPVPTYSGETVVVVPGGRQVAALYRVIPGQEPDRSSPVHARAIGEALGWLHLGFARVDVGPPPPRVGAFGTIDRLLETPDELIAAELPALDADTARRVRSSLASLAEQLPALLAGLPRQLCHCDYNPGNTLLVGDRVTAVLDFEVAGPDVRAFDLGLSWYYVCSRSPEDRWTPIAAFGAGYRAIVATTAQELTAAAELPRLYVGGSLLYQAGLVRRGQLDAARLQARAEQLGILDRFLAANRQRVVDTLAGEQRLGACDKGP
jgi:homoserine kinase type II